MTILIIEDELEAVARLQMFLTRRAEEMQANIRVVGVLDSVKDAIAWFGSNPPPDLVLLDIHLSDGLSFEIFNHVPVLAPIIFTTAYDEYALHAFNVHSIAYLLKPCSYADFTAALEKLARQKAMFANEANEANAWQRDFQTSLQETSASVKAMQKRYKTRFMLHVAEKIIILSTEQVAYCEAEGKVVTLITTGGKRYIAEQSLDELEHLLDPILFFRISRKYLVQASAIAEAEPYFNGRLVLKLLPTSTGEALVSRERVKDFKAWLEGA
jgi:two-component system, LytTR family, response regulator LytT